MKMKKRYLMDVATTFNLGSRKPSNNDGDVLGVREVVV
jgi:hypothetical protein